VRAYALAEAAIGLYALLIPVILWAYPSFNSWMYRTLGDRWLLLSMVGVGFAWASIVSLPYALLAGSVPSRKMGVYMGIFNFFIVIPQLVIASVLGVLLNTFFDGEPLSDCIDMLAG
jgi:MFS family permease